ncbi:unnamed protein product, partial [Ectocarpus sp. 12 AP-2014]
RFFSAGGAACTLPPRPPCNASRIERTFTRIKSHRRRLPSRSFSSSCRLHPFHPPGVTLVVARARLRTHTHHAPWPFTQNASPPPPPSLLLQQEESRASAGANRYGG